MNWLWVILGAIGGALLQESGGLLLGAILGAMASRLSQSAQRAGVRKTPARTGTETVQTRTG